MPFLWYGSQATAQVCADLHNLIGTHFIMSLSIKNTTTGLWCLLMHNMRVGDGAVPAFRDVIDVPLIVREVSRTRQQVIDLFPVNEF